MGSPHGELHFQRKHQGAAGLNLDLLLEIFVPRLHHLQFDRPARKLVAQKLTRTGVGRDRWEIGGTKQNQRARDRCMGRGVADRSSDSARLRRGDLFDDRNDLGARSPWVHVERCAEENVERGGGRNPDRDRGMDAQLDRRDQRQVLNRRHLQSQRHDLRQRRGQGNRVPARIHQPVARNAQRIGDAVLSERRQNWKRDLHSCAAKDPVEIVGVVRELLGRPEGASGLQRPGRVPQKSRVQDTTRALQPTHAFGAAEQFAYNANNFNRVFGSAGMEIPLPILTPFGEYSITYPLGVPGNRLVDPSGNSIPLTAALPQIVTMGLKVTAIQDLTLIAAIDLRVHSSVAIGIPTPAPFDVFFGASLNVDPWRARTQIVPIVKEVPAAQAGRIAGTVSDAATHAPIAGALILFGPTDLPPVASNAGSGKFLSYELPRGAIKLKVMKTGYEDLEQQVQIESGRTLVLPLEMKLAVRRTHLWVSVASDNRGVAARVSIRGPAIREVATVEGASEALDVEVKPGAYALAVSAPGYLGQTRSIEIGEGAELAVKFDLVPEPKEKLVTIVNKKIETVRRIHFITAKATLLPDSYALLQQVADLILKSDIKRIRIVGHTDNSGTKKRNLKLSVARAASVAAFLEKAGIENKRIETTGYGDARPVVPNLTARGREINRRVEILILD